MNLEHLEYIPDEVKRLHREVSDAEWNDDPRLGILVNELRYYQDKMDKGEMYEPTF